MIIYGWNAKNIKQAPVDNHECAHCQQKQSVIVIFAKYFHLFWIPVFPFKKMAIIVCTHCKHETEEIAMTLSYETIQKLKSAVPIPKYLFSGLALIVLGVAWLIYEGIQDDAREQAYINDPHAGDVYLIKNNEEETEYNHFLMKVRKVEGDSLWVSYSSFSYNGIVTKLDPKDGFYNVMYAMHKNGIKDISESGELMKVIRDYSASDGFDREVEFEEPDSVGN